MWIILLKTIKWLLIIAVVLGVAVYAFLNYHPVFGGKPDAATQARMAQSPYFKNGTFENIDPTVLNTAEDGSSVSLLGWLADMVSPPKGRRPAQPLPSENTDFHDKNSLPNNHFAWLGHSTLLMNINGKTILTDPVFHRASPIPLGAAPFEMTRNFTAADMPNVDMILISHDHYDHLDYKAIGQLSDKATHFYVPLGVKAHLQRWGVAAEKITELDWHESANTDGVTLTFVPTRHFSGRSFNDRATTLWGGWAIKSPELNILFGADSGYGTQFAEIGKRYGGFDLVMLDSGAFNENWAQIHMLPEQLPQAAQDLNAKTVLPIHWAKFDLAYHTWKTPIERFLSNAEGQPYQVATPKLGEVFGLDKLPSEKWWEGVE